MPATQTKPVTPPRKGRKVVARKKATPKPKVPVKTAPQKVAVKKKRVSRKPKQKAKTIPEMKRSIGNLYEALMKSKEKHRKASALVGQMKVVISRMMKTNTGLAEQVDLQESNIEQNAYDQELTAEVMADLIKRLR